MADLIFKRWSAWLGRRNRWLVLVVILPTLLIGLALLFDWWPMLRGGFGWRWPYVAPWSESLTQYLPFLFGIALYLLGLRILTGRAAWLYVTWCVFGTILLSVTVLLAQGDPLYLLFNRTISGLTTGGFTVATHTDDFSTALRRWPELMPTFESFSSHMVISPPGWPLSFALVGNVFDKLAFLANPLAAVLRPLQCNDIPLMELSDGQIGSAWLGIASPLWAALTVIPLYDLGRRLGGARLGRRVSAWWPLIPSLLMFLGTLSTPYPLGSMIVLWFFWLGLERAKKGKFAPVLVIAGATTGLLLFYSFAFLPYILFLGLFTLLFWQDFGQGRFRLKVRPPVLTGLQFGAGLVAVLVVHRLVTGHTILAIFQSAMTYHLELARSYWPWLILHTWDYALFLGLVVFLLAIVGTFYLTTGSVRKMAIALSLTLFIIVISGTGRGETGRIWLFFAPISLLIAADVVNALPRASRRLLLATQLFWLIVVVLILRTVGGAYTPPPDLAAVRFSTAPEPSMSTAIDFGDVLQLQGFSGQLQTDPAQLAVDLYWRTNRAIKTPYFFSAVIVSPDGLPLADHNWQPFDYQFPTTCWHDAAEEGPIVDRVIIPVPQASPAGDYWLSLRMFSLREDAAPHYVSINIPGVGQDDQVGLGPITVGVSPSE